MQRDRTEQGIQEQIERLAADWRDAFNRGDASKVEALYTEDGALQAVTGEVHAGRDAIRRRIEENIRAGGRFDSDVAEAEVLSGGGEAFCRGSFRVLDPNGNVVREGNWHAVMRRDGDGWKIHRQIAAIAAPPLEG